MLAETTYTGGHAATQT